MRPPVDDPPTLRIAHHRSDARGAGPLNPPSPIGDGERRRTSPRLTFRRLSGLDRSGPPPPQTLPGAPLNPWTVPNAIGLLRLVLVPVFLVLALRSDHGTDAGPFVLFVVISASDYADGIAARITKQYSRFGALLDPVVDRLLVLAGLIVCWKFELLPRWGLALLVAREAVALAGGRYAMIRGVALQINWLGRWGVWPTMAALGFGLANLQTTGKILLAIGLLLSWAAVVQYYLDARRLLKIRDAAGSTSR